MPRTVTKQQFKQFNPQGTEDLDEWRKIFVEIEDPMEYEAAIQLVGSWTAWERLKTDWPHFKNKILPEWLIELEVRLRSKAILRMIKSTEPSAQKWVAEGRYKLPEEKKAAEDRKRERQVKRKTAEKVDDDVERVMQSANVVKLERN